MVKLSRRQFLGASAASLLLSVTRIGFAAEAPTVIALRIWPAQAYTRITIESSEELKYKYFSLPDPNRLVVDIQGVTLNQVLKDIHNKILENDPYIKMARVGQFDANTTRIVLDLKTKVNPQVFTLKPIAEFKHRLVVDLYPDSPHEESDPLMMLLEDYNKGKINQEGMDSSEQNTGPTPVDKKPPDKSKGTGKQTVINKRKNSFIVVLDPGHGGEDPGAIGPSGLREKDVVLKIAREVKKILDAQGNITTYLTRNEDVFIPLSVRVAKARKLNADLFISVHADAFSSPIPRGSSVFALSRKGATSTAARFLAQSQNESDLIGGVKIRTGDAYLDQTIFDLTQTATTNNSLKLGKQILKELGKVNALHKAQVEQAGFAVLKAPDIPSILVETAFISNPTEESLLKTAAFHKKIARAMTNGVRDYFAQSTIIARN